MPRRRAARTTRHPEFCADRLTDAYADAIGADEHDREEISLLVLTVDEHLRLRGQPGAWTRIHIAALAEEMPERGDARRWMLFRLTRLLEWMAEERLIPFVRAIDYALEVDRLCELPDPPSAVAS